MQLLLRPSLFGFVVGTRVALALGIGLLVADRIPPARRRSLAWTLIGIGAVTTVPAVRGVLRSRDVRRGLEARLA